ncbi:murein biosynthesis integral membrane protein MurJ [soil metagenome]
MPRRSETFRVPSSTILRMTGILRSMLTISAATVISRATGYLRIAAMAAVLGSTIVADAYAVAALLPTLIYELLIGGILYSIFIPVLVERRTNHGEEDAQRLTNALFTVVSPLLLVMTVAGILLARPLVELATAWGAAAQLSPGEAERATDLAVLLFRIFALQILFYGVTTIGTGVLQAHRRFFLPTFAPALNNLIIVASFVAYAFLNDSNPAFAIYVLAGGVTLGVAVMALVLVPTMLGLGYVPRPQWGHPALMQTVRLAGPMVVLVAASVGFQLFGTFMATQFKAAALLGYAFAIFSLPYGIFVVAIATALMPELSEKHSREDLVGYRDTFSFGLRVMSFVVVPSMVALVALAEPMVGLLYERLNFDAQDTQRVAALLAAYSIGLLGYSAYFFFVRAFYSLQNTMTPATLNVLILAVYVVLVYALAETFGAIGIPLALSITYSILALLALAAMRREIKWIDGRQLLRSLAKILLAGVIMYAVSQAGTILLGTGAGALGRALIIVTVGGTSLAAYLGAAFLLKAEEISWAATLLRRRIGRKPSLED